MEVSISLHGQKLNEEEDAYTLAIPFSTWAQTPKSIRVIPADGPQVDGIKGQPSVVFIAYVEKAVSV